MGTRIEFRTPENIAVSYPLAGAGSRYLAFAVDVLLLALLYLIGAILFMLAFLGLASMDATAGLVSEVNGAILILIVATLSGFGFLLYFILSEYFMSGQTPGKRLLRCRVVMERGFALSPAAILIRGIFRVIDVLPVLWIVPLANEKVQRLGDMVAGTVVVMEDEVRISPMRGLLLARDSERIVYRFGAAQVAALSSRDIEALEKYCERRENLPAAQRDDIAAKIVRGLARRVGMAEPIAKAQEEQFIADLLDAHYRREARELA